MPQTPVVIVAVALSTLLFTAAPAVAAPARVNDLTPAFRTAGIQLDRLQVFEVGGVVVLRGRTYDRALAEQAGRHAITLGYSRVANLIQILEAPDDQAIERAAERELTVHRGLDGCRFHVQANSGIVRVAGRVRHELQKDMAVAVLRSVDGVREVKAELTLD